MTTSAPKEAHGTLTQRVVAALSGGEAKTLKELSADLHVTEKSLPELLSKVQRSLAHSDLALLIVPSFCISCGFSFKSRERFARPGRCPECKSLRIAPPKFECVRR